MSKLFSVATIVLFSLSLKSVGGDLRLDVDHTFSIYDYVTGEPLQPSVVDNRRIYDVSLDQNRVYRGCRLSNFATRTVRIVWNPPETYKRAEPSYDVIVRVLKDTTKTVSQSPNIKLEMPDSSNDASGDFLDRVDRRTGGDFTASLSAFLMTSFLHHYNSTRLGEKHGTTDFAARVAVNSLGNAEAAAASYWGVSYAPLQPSENYVQQLSPFVNDRTIDEFSNKNLGFFFRSVRSLDEAKKRGVCERHEDVIDELVSCYASFSDAEKTKLSQLGFTPDYIVSRLSVCN